MGNYLDILPEQTGSQKSSSCTTNIRKTSFQHSWTINDFSLYQSKAWKSVIFSTGGLSSTTFFHRLSVIGDAHTSKGLQLETVIQTCDSTSQLYGTLQVGLPVATPERVRTFHLSGSLKAGCAINHGYGVHMPYPRLQNDKLHLTFELTVLKELPSVGGCTQIREAPSKLVTNMGALFSNPQYTDVTIVVGAREFAAHRAILASRSPVFAAMFETGMVEAVQQRVIITDIEPDIFQELLRFVYTDNVHYLDKHAYALLPAADKYALDKLKSMCEVALYESLSIETAISTLVVADLHGSEQLKKETINFVRNYSAKILVTPEWTEIWSNHPQLRATVLVELMNALKF